MAFSNPFLATSGKTSGNPFFPDEEVATSELPLWQRNELLERLGGATSTTASKLFGTLAVPGSILYDMALARPLGSGSTGGEVLDALQIRPDRDALGGWGRPVADFAFEAATDPLNLVSAGAGTAARATAAAKAANLFGDVQRVAGRSLVDDVATGARQLDNLGDMGYAENARRSFAENFQKGLGELTDDDLLSRPLVGKRTAARDTRLRDLVDASPDPTAAIRGVDNFLSKYNQSYADVADDFLYNDFGIRLPKALGGELAFQVPGGAKVAAALDRAGQGVRWSAVGRGAVAASNVFGDNVLGTVREGDQIIAKSHVRADQAADLRSRRIINEMTRDLQDTAPEVFTNPALSSAVRNVIEGTASAAERNMVTNNRLDPFVTRWQTTAQDYIRRSREAGIGSGELDDAYGTGYFPRGYDETIFPRGGTPADGGKQYSVMTGDQMARSDAYSVPGGTQRINELSRDANIHDAVTDGEAADYILTELNRDVLRLNQGRAADALFPAYSRDKAVKLARDIRAMSPEAVRNGRGLFDSHFMEDFSRYVTGRERAIGRSKVLYDTIGSSATLDHYLNVPTAALGRHNPLNQTLNNLNLRTVELPTYGPLPPNAPLTRAQARVQGPNVQHFPPDQTVGARKQIVDRLNERLDGTGIQLTEADLANVSVDAELVGRLNRIADFYTVPEVQGVWVDAIDGITNLWKASVLSWPARFLRDWYSGIATNLVEAGPQHLPSGYAGAKYLMQGQFDRLQEVVRRMPEYAQQAQTDMQGAVRRYQSDLAASGMLRGRRIEDLGTNLTNRQTGQGIRDEMLPGVNPVTTVGYQVGDALTGRMPLSTNNAAYSELGNLGAYRDSVRRFGQAINPFNDEVPFIEYLNEREITDPIFRWSNRLGDTTDSINRLAGFNALLLDGVSVDEAARRIMRAQVDYSNMSRFERGAIKRIVPFWMYSSRTAKWVAEKIWENPGGRYTQAMLRGPEKLQQAGQSDEAYVPKQVKTSLGVSLEPMRDLPGIGSLVDAVAPSKDGVMSYLADVDLPGTDLINMVSMRSGLDGSPQIGNSLKQTAFGVTSQLMHPALRAGVELLTGQNLHTGKSLNDFEPTTQKLGRALGVEPFSGLDQFLKYANYGMDYVPHAPRILQMTNRLLDSERVPDPSARLLQNAINALSGVKVTNISEDAARLDASRELGEMLGDSPALRTFEQRFIPKDLLQYASPEDILLYRLDRQMRGEARKARKALSDSDTTNPFFN